MDNIIKLMEKLCFLFKNIFSGFFPQLKFNYIQCLQTPRLPTFLPPRLSGYGKGHLDICIYNMCLFAGTPTKT